MSISCIIVSGTAATFMENLGTTAAKSIRLPCFFRKSFLLFSLSAIWILDDSSAVGAGKLVLVHCRWGTKYRFWSAGPSLKFSKDIVNSPVFFPYEDRILVDQLRLTHFPSHHTVCTFVFNNAFHCAAQPADSLQQELTFYEVKRSTSVQFDEIPCWVYWDREKVGPRLLECCRQKW